MGQHGSGRGSFEQARSTRRTSVLTEFLGYLRQSKKWWMLPILLVMLCLGALALLSSSPIAPFVYTLL